MELDGQMRLSSLPLSRTHLDLDGEDEVVSAVAQGNTPPRCPIVEPNLDSGLADEVLLLEPHRMMVNDYLSLHPTGGGAVSQGWKSIVLTNEPTFLIQQVSEDLVVYVLGTRASGPPVEGKSYLLACGGFDAVYIISK